MQIAMVGLGRMGGNMARRLLRGGHAVVAYATDPEAVRQLAAEGATGAATLDEVVARLAPPRTAWVMVPSGAATEQVVHDLAARMVPGDTIVDGGNSYFKDDVRRAAALAGRGLHYVDVGTSGGIWGIDRGYCLMIGGEAAVVERLDPIFRTLAPGEGSVSRTPGREGAAAPAELGYLRCGPVGAGHFVKMIHNGIEYGLMQAYAEGFALLAGKSEFGFDAAAVAELWRHGSVVRSWLLDLMAENLRRDAALEGIAPVVADSGEGRWTAIEAVELGIPAPVITLALAVRFASQGKGDYGARQLAQLRRSFGGHAVKPAGDRSGHAGKPAGDRSGHAGKAAGVRGGRAVSKSRKS